MTGEICLQSSKLLILSSFYRVILNLLFLETKRWLADSGPFSYSGSSGIIEYSSTFCSPCHSVSFLTSPLQSGHLGASSLSTPIQWVIHSRQKPWTQLEITAHWRGRPRSISRTPSHRTLSVAHRRRRSTAFRKGVLMVDSDVKSAEKCPG